MDFFALRPISYDNGYIVIPNINNKADASRVLDIFLCAVLDGHVPVTKVIGFSLETPEVKNNQNTMRFIGSGYTLESVPEIANQLSKLIVLGWDITKDKRVYQLDGVSAPKGARAIPVVTGPSLTLAPNTTSSPHLHFMQDGVQICRFNNNKVIMKVVLSTDTGFHDMADTSRVAWINDCTTNETEETRLQYFFMNVNFSLVDFIRILPPRKDEYFTGNSVKIRVKFINGLTPEIFSKMWGDMYEDINQQKWLKRRLQVGG